VKPWSRLRRPHHLSRATLASSHSSLRVSEIARAAALYFEEHAQALMEVAWRKVQSPDLMRFYTKEQKDRLRKTLRIEQNSQHLCNLQRPANQALPLNETHAQN
jgi:hypothetical protein